METKEKNELSIVVEQSGIEKTKGELISNTLGQFFEKAGEWNDTIEALQINDVSEVGKMKMAKEGRLTLKNQRISCKKIVEEKRLEVKAKMADYVLEDKLWLKAFQMIEATYKNLETKLEEKEKYAERKERERIDVLERERINKLLPYNEFCYIENMDLRTMSDDDYNKEFEKAKKMFDLDKAEKERVEKERLAKEKAEAAERERIRKENERLKKEAEERERKAKIEAEKRAKAEAERKEKEEAERKKREEAEAKKRAEYEAKLKKEREEKARIEAELKKKKEAEEAEKRRIESEQKAAKEAKRKAALAPQKTKITNWVNSFELPELNKKGFDESALEKVGEISEKFVAFTQWAIKQAESIN